MKRSQGNLTQLVASLLAILCFSQTRCFGQGGKGKQGWRCPAALGSELWEVLMTQHVALCPMVRASGAQEGLVRRELPALWGEAGT